MDMNSFAGKQLLSRIRDGDFAHPGEEEAIEIALADCPRRPNQFLLDVGCGSGGTAQYVRKNGWGTVVGLDPDSDSIARARQVYPRIDFHACDIVDAPLHIGRTFDVIYLFNSFYAFPDQGRALGVMSKLACDSGRLVLFDYTDRGGYQDNPLWYEGSPFLPHPIPVSTFGETLRHAGWQLIEVVDLTESYQRWYSALVQRMDRKREELTLIAGIEGFDAVREQYARLLGAIQDGRLGGAVIRASKITSGM